MTRTRRRDASGFTLVELLTVISIIALLISILLPSLAQARAQAKKVKVQTQIDAIAKGLEMFRNDHRDQYPASDYGYDPLRNLPNQTSKNQLSGAHWLARAMVGPDMRGIDVEAKASVPQPSDSPILDYQAATPSNPAYNSMERSGTYIQLETAPAIRDNDPDKAPNVTLSPATGRLILLDGYGFPILYYRADPGAGDIAFVRSRKGGGNPGVYCREDNADFTGTDSTDGWILKPGKQHKLKVFDLRATGDCAHDGCNWPQSDTFNSYFFNPDVFTATQSGGHGTIKPYNADSFILLSPGADGIYGTRDDVKNFKVTQ